MGEGVVDPTSHLVCYKTTKYLYRAYSVQRPHTLYIPATVGVPAARRLRLAAYPRARSGSLLHPHRDRRRARLEDAVKLRCDANEGQDSLHAH